MTCSITNPYNKEYSVTVEDALIQVLLCVCGEDTDETVLFQTHHTHASTELFICTQGELVISTENGNIYLHRYDAAIIPAYMAHTKTNSAISTSWQSVAFSLHKRASNNKSGFHKSLDTLCSGKNAIIVRKQKTLCEAVKNLTSNASCIQSLPALRLCLCLAEIADTYKAPNIGINRRQTTPTDINHASKLEHIINSRYMDSLSTEEVAKYLCVSKRQLSRIVNKRYGTTLHRVILKQRLKAAAVMLEQTNKPVQDIAKSVGFCESSAFYREFKSAYLSTPAEYRKQLQNN